MTTPTFANVLSCLRPLGLTRAQVAAIMPAWWDRDVAATDSGLWETVILLARRLGLDAKALHEGVVSPLSAATPRFKHTVRVKDEQLRAATLIATSVAAAVLGAVPPRDPLASESPTAIRESILSTPDARVDFDSILNFCWYHGLPVIPLPHLPKGVRKMDAAALTSDRRPAIVVALRSESKAWLSFLLAHELGHICHGHVANDASLIEGSIRDSAEFDAQSQMDHQEIEANTFAHALLGGKEADEVLAAWPNALPPVSMATRAMEDAASLHISPGHLILRHAFMTGRWPEGREALRYLSDDMDAQTTLVDKLRREIDTSALGDDLQDYVEQVTGVAPRR